MSPGRAVQHTAEVIAQNTLLTVTSRLAALALPVLIAALAWLGQARVDAAEAALANAAADVRRIESRVTVVETVQGADREERARFYGAVDRRLEAIEQAVSGLATTAAALDATLKAERRPK